MRVMQQLLSRPAKSRYYSESRSWLARLRGRPVRQCLYATRSACKKPEMSMVQRRLLANHAWRQRCYSDNATLGGVGVSSTWPDRYAAQPVWDASLAYEAQRIAAAATTCRSAVVTGHTTPNLADVGGASVRVRFDLPLEEGGYLLGIRPLAHGHRWLPAIAGVPGPCNAEFCFYAVADA